MPNINEYDILVCTAVKNDPLGFVDILLEEANKDENKNVAPILREAACVIANLLKQAGEGLDWKNAE